MSPTASAQDQSHRRLEHDIRGLISTLTHHLMSLGKSGDRQADETPDSGSRIITLAGENKGSTLRVAGWDDAFDAHGVLHGGDDRLSALANSNYQAANNSILIGGNCVSEDPGVHIAISDYVEDDLEDEKKHKKKEKDEKKKKKRKEEKGSSKEEEEESDEEEGEKHKDSK